MEIAYIANFPFESWNIENIYYGIYWYAKWTNFFKKEINLYLFKDFKKNENCYLSFLSTKA